MDLGQNNWKLIIVLAKYSKKRIDCHSFIGHCKSRNWGTDYKRSSKFQTTSYVT